MTQQMVYDIKSLWRRTFEDIKGFDFSYESYRRYLQQSAGIKKFYGEQDYQNVLGFLKIKYEVSRNVTPDKAKKRLEFYKALAQYKDGIPGDILIRESERLAVCSRTTIYKKCHKKLGKKFSFKARYSSEEVKKLIF